MAEAEVLDRPADGKPELPHIIETKYRLENGRVVEIGWDNGHEQCSAKILEDNPDYYQYISKLEGDIVAQIAPQPMNLGDCILAANMHLGLIPAIGDVRAFVVTKFGNQH